jgi:hypothetical protein
VYGVGSTFKFKLKIQTHSENRIQSTLAIETEQDLLQKEEEIVTQVSQN